MIKLILKTAPAVEPVSLAEMRAMLGITDGSDTHRDAVITARITAARRWAEEHCRRAFVTQTWTLHADRFWCYRTTDRRYGPYPFDLKPALQSVTSVKYIDTAGTQQTLAADQYQVDTVNSRLYSAYGVNWPVTRRQPNAVEIEHVSGYGAASTVPQEIKESLMFIVGHWENYQSSIEGAVRVTTIPYAVTQLLSPYVDLRNSF